MKELGFRPLFSFLPRSKKVVAVRLSDVRKNRAYRVGNFMELASCVAELSFRNPEFLLFFRGQGSDHRNQRGNTTIKPRIFRPATGQLNPPSPDVIARRYLHLESAEQVLATKYADSGFLGKDRIRRYRVVRWAILQHYQICDTPLVDMTVSLRVATSFAHHARSGDEAFVMVVALPNLAGSVTASSEEGVQVVRLNSICPPAALRPHLQEGYLVGEYPQMDSPSQKSLYKPFEVDFGLRLLAKFRFEPKSFWRKNRAFPPIPRPALYPDPEDRFFKLATDIKMEIGRSDY
jgi:hypothetical protein